MLWLCAWVGLFLMALASAAEGQELARSLEQLRVLVKPGDTLSVTDATGREFKGTLAELSSSSLELVVAGVRRSVPESDISTIRQRRPDSLANGAKWGFGIGAVFGLLAGAAIASDEDDSAAIIPVVALLYGGIGAGVGVGVDAMISGNQVIYASSTRSSGSVTLVPIVTGDRKRVLVSVGF